MSEFRVHLHLCSEGDEGGCFTDTQTLASRPAPVTIKALLDEARDTFSLLFDAEACTQTVELSKAGDEDGVLDAEAAEKK